MSAQPPPDPRFFHPQLARVTSFEASAMGLTAEHLAKAYNVSRAAQDEMAARSHHRAAAAIPAANLQREILPTWGHDEAGQRFLVTADQCVRPETTAAVLAKLPAAFERSSGSISAGNSSPRNDGAAALLIMSRERATSLGYAPLAAVGETAVAGVTPCEMGLGPVPAIKRLLAKKKQTLATMDQLELNEAFAAQVLACVQVGDLPLEKLNLRGGAIAQGHPLGASGAKIVLSLLHSLHTTNAVRGIAALCVGMGQGMATLIERD